VNNTRNQVLLDIRAKSKRKRGLGHDVWMTCQKT
jgi:hypothetical protein